MMDPPSSSYPQQPQPQSISDKLVAGRPRARSLPISTRFRLNGEDGSLVAWEGQGAGKNLIIYDETGTPTMVLSGGAVPASASQVYASNVEEELLTPLSRLSNDDDDNIEEDDEEVPAYDDEPNISKSKRVALAKQAILDAYNMQFVPQTSGFTEAVIRSKLQVYKELVRNAIRPWVRAAGRPGLNSEQGVSWAAMKQDGGQTFVENCKRVRGYWHRYFETYIGKFNDMVASLPAIIAAPDFTESAKAPPLNRQAQDFFASGHWAQPTLTAITEELYHQAMHYVSLTGVLPRWGKFRLTETTIDDLYDMFVKYKEFKGLRASFISQYLDPVRKEGANRNAAIRMYIVDKVRSKVEAALLEGGVDAQLPMTIDSYRTTAQRYTAPEQQVVDFARLYFLNKRVARMTEGGTYALKKLPKGIRSEKLPSNFADLSEDNAITTYNRFIVEYDEAILTVTGPELERCMSHFRLKEVVTSSSKSKELQSENAARRSSGIQAEGVYWARVGAENTSIEDQEKIIAPAYQNLVREANLPAGDSQDLSEELRDRKNTLDFDLDALRLHNCGLMVSELASLRSDTSTLQMKNLISLISRYTTSSIQNSISEKHQPVSPSMEDSMINCNRIFLLCKAEPALSSLADEIISHVVFFMAWVIRSSQPVLPIIAFLAWFDQLWIRYASSIQYTSLAVRAFDLIETDAVFALAGAAFKSTAGWIIARNGRTSTGQYTSIKTPNPAYIEQIRDLQFGQSGSLDNDDAILWHPDQRLKDREPRYVAVGSWRARTPDRFLQNYKGIVCFISGPCPWVYINGTWIPCLGLVWLSIGYAFRYSDKNKRGKPNVVARHMVPSRAQALARAEQLQEADENFTIDSSDQSITIPSTSEPGTSSKGLPAQKTQEKRKDKGKERESRRLLSIRAAEDEMVVDEGAMAVEANSKRRSSRLASTSSSKRRRTIPQDEEVSA